MLELRARPEAQTVAIAFISLSKIIVIPSALGVIM